MSPAELQASRPNVQLLEYVFPSVPQTGRYTAVHISGHSVIIYYFVLSVIVWETKNINKKYGINSLELWQYLLVVW